MSPFVQQCSFFISHKFVIILVLMIQMCVFCFSFRDADWDGAFNFTKDLTFLTMCAQQMKGALLLSPIS